MKRVNLAVIGCGAVAEIFHLPTLQRMPEFEIKYLVDINENRIKEIKDKLKIEAKSSTDYEAVLRDEEVEAVMILTPPHLHHQMVLKAAEAKKHIFCEKPFTMNAEQAIEMIKACNENGVKITGGFNFRFIPQFSKIKELIDKGFFGKLIGGHSTLFADAFSWPTVSKFQYDKKKGGGALFEMGCHHIDLMNWFFGEPSSVVANIASLNKNSSVDDTASVYIQYENGANAVVYIGWNRLSINTVTVFGLDGYATATGGKNEVLYHRKDLIAQPPIRIRVDKGQSPYHRELYHFYECIVKNRNSIITQEEIIDSVWVAEKAYESAESKKMVLLQGG
jgi:predicted dehydrogenase